jgi:xanthine dehydrogenase YagS FAD-binding subunit
MSRTSFKHVEAHSVEEAVHLLKEYRGTARMIAGGTDLIGGLKDDIWPDRPEVLIDIKKIPGLGDIQETEKGLKIGPLCTLSTLAATTLIRERFTALAEAARRTASPLLRNIGTLGGNICQENRCWYYRYPDKLGGRIPCVRKGGEKCLAVTGDHRYHSIFGAVNKCIAVNPGDTAPALLAFGAVIETSRRTLNVEDFFSARNGVKSTALADDEMVTAVRLPWPASGTRSAFRKLALRKTIDFAIVNGAACLAVKEGKITAASIWLNAVHNNPVRAANSEDLLLEKTLNESLAREASESAVAEARPLKMNRYKVQMTRALTADLIMDCA